MPAAHNRQLAWNIFFALLVHGGIAHASPSGIAPGYPENVEAMDPREVAMLPPYCRYTQVFRDRVPGGRDPVEIARWSNAMGPVFNAMHHYCVGLMKTNRAVMIAKTAQYRKFYLESAIQEFEYVLRNAAPDFALLPEILTRKGETLIRLGRAAPGLTELDQAAALKPDYWPPYAVMADHYKRAGDMAKARAVLERGLAAAPDAKPLQRRLTELGVEPRSAGIATRTP